MAEYNARLEIPAIIHGSSISPLLFGHNFEITRKASWQGLAAEMLANRKFAVVAKSGIPLHWTAIESFDRTATGLSETQRKEKAVTIDEDTAYAGNPSVYVSVPERGQECGIAQGHDNLTLERRRRYRIKIWVKVEEPTTVIVRLRRQDGNPIHFEGKQRVRGAGWQCVAMEFVASQAEPAARFEVVGLPRGQFHIGAASLQPADAIRGMRKDVIQRLKEMQVKLLRYPGGCFAEYYNWRDGLLPVDARPPIGPAPEKFLLPYTDGFDTHEIGVDEYMALCRELNCEPAITVRITEGSPAEAASWVEYCNGGNDTKWGRVRRERGHAEPYSVKYWFLGNEISYWWGRNGGPSKTERYVDLCVEFAKAMKRVDPSIRLIGSGVAGVRRAGHRFQTPTWDEKVLAKAGSVLDAYSYHEYIYPEKAIDRTAAAPLNTSLHMLESLREMIDRISPSAPRKTIFYDEWNVWGAWDRTPGVQEALFTANTLHMLCREANRLGIEASCYFQPVNEGAVDVLPHAAWLTPVGTVFSVFASHAGGFPLAISAGKQPCDMFASLSKDGRSLTLTAVNYDATVGRSVRLQVVNRSVERIEAARVYVAKNNDPSSDLKELGCEVVGSPKGCYSFALPRLSFAYLNLRIADE